MTKILNLALKIKGDGREGGTCEVLRPYHPPPPKNLERALDRMRRYKTAINLCLPLYCL